ncbi:hypothetical protein MDV072.2 [Gallid alphaherpesvirus 2]|uniref:Uncharacterized protein n=1 Tax=Gallid alphaherpesvirus 2 TaxID=10390 RepID=Q19B82_9ALPH|nr:hypothetical protein MDV072.2 [Gallid alphaherpesvirus 2]QOJ42197.1 hypothetical protein [synthetic construct]ABR13151.1 hypothetical protein MDV072.2 [Gallid alphaherpesvirus 2]ACF94978.1 hypothetical protein MDV072.2 [Gallid alphaherpesvirus 2]AFM74639.1 hypothetical protein [Gallid alphaherpesvirus 2]
MVESLRIPDTAKRSHKTSNLLIPSIKVVISIAAPPKENNVSVHVLAPFSTLLVTTERLKIKANSGLDFSSGTLMRRTVLSSSFLKLDLPHFPALLQSAEKNLRTIGVIDVPMNTLKHKSCGGYTSVLSISRSSNFCFIDSRTRSQSLFAGGLHNLLKKGLINATAPHLDTCNGGIVERATGLSVNKSRRIRRELRYCILCSAVYVE